MAESVSEESTGFTVSVSMFGDHLSTRWVYCSPELKVTIHPFPKET